MNIKDKIDNSAVVNIITTSGRKIKIKGDKKISILDITSDYITVKFDSHISDFYIYSIEEIEYYGGRYYSKYNDS